GINCVDLWDLKERKLWKSLPEIGKKSLHLSLKFSHDDTSLAELWQDETIRLMDVQLDRFGKVFRRRQYLKDVAFTNKNELLALQHPWDEPDVLDVWHVNKQKRLCRIKCAPMLEIDQVLMSNDATMVAAAMSDGTLRIWKIQSE